MQIGPAAKQISTRINRGRILRGMKGSHLISFVCGLMLVIGFNTLRGSNTEPSPHVYELRLYHVNPGKMNELIGYWVPEDPPSSQNLFVYVLQHPSRQEADKNWAAFQADREWQKVKAESEKNGSLVDHIERYFMDPTSFSALK